MTTQTDLPTADEIRAAEGDDLSRWFHRIVLGDDLTHQNRDGRIMSACESFSFRGELQGADEGALGKQFWRDAYSRFRDYAALLKAWDARSGQPWQAALEAHVAAWRAKPRPWATDCGLLEEMCEELWSRFRISMRVEFAPDDYETMPWYAAASYRVRAWSEIHAKPMTAATRAACLAVLAKKQPTPSAGA